MRRITAVTKNWKQLRQAFIGQDLYRQRVQSLHALLATDITGFSLDKMVMHYSALSFFAQHAAVCQYVQTGASERAGAYFHLSALAKQTSCGLLLSNPRREFARVNNLQLDSLTAAVLCGHLPAALALLNTERAALSREKAPAGAKRPPSRADKRLEERRKIRLSLEIGFYECLLKGQDAQAQQLLSQLEGQDTPERQVMRAFFAPDSALFSDALIQHMKEFRSTPEPDELNVFVLLMEALYQKRRTLTPLDLADAPAAFLALPEGSAAQTEADLGISLPCFDTERLLPLIAPANTGPSFQRY